MTRAQAANLTPRQKQHVWLLGSYPDKIAVQGRGYRSKELLYGLKDEELVIFGYSSPFLWLKNRGIVRKLANANAYALTEVGEQVFQRLLLSGFGADAPVREVRVA